MKTTEEVLKDLLAATPMELACSNNEMLVTAIRKTVEQGNEEMLRKALAELKSNVEMMQEWLDKAAN